MHLYVVKYILIAKTQFVDMQMFEFFVFLRLETMATKLQRLNL